MSATDTKPTVVQYRQVFNTVTPKHFTYSVTTPYIFEAKPTGVWDYRRVDLETILPAVRGLSLWVYWHLRIACCARLLHIGDKLVDCQVCRDNTGFVCPFCLGNRFVSYKNQDGRIVADPCTRCCLVRPGEKKDTIVVEPDAQMKLIAVNNWLAKRFPYGVPSAPTADDLRIMDGQ